MCYNYRPAPLPVVCGWCGYPVFIAIRPFLLDPGCPGGPLFDPGGGCPLPVLFVQALGDPGWPMVLCPLGDLVKGPACLLWM